MFSSPKRREADIQISGRFLLPRVDMHSKVLEKARNSRKFCIVYFTPVFILS